MKAFDDLERLDCMIEGLECQLELLYVMVENMGEEDIPTVTGAVYALQEYADHMNQVMRSYQKALIKGAKRNEV